MGWKLIAVGVVALSIGSVSVFAEPPVQAATAPQSIDDVKSKLVGYWEFVPPQDKRGDFPRTILRFDKDGKTYQITSKSPIPDYPRAKQGKWTLAVEQEKVVVNTDDGRVQETVVVRSIDDKTLTVVPKQKPASLRGGSIELKRVSDPPAWATDLSDVKFAAPPKATLPDEGSVPKK
jgi:hypothetical protein